MEKARLLVVTISLVAIMPHSIIYHTLCSLVHAMCWPSDSQNIEQFTNKLKTNRYY